MGNQYQLGTALKISVVTSISSPDSVTVAIKDIAGTLIQNYTPATLVAPKVYEYIYQSLETQSEGQYFAFIKVTYGAYASIEKVRFNLRS